MSFFDGRRAYSYLNEPDQPQWFIEYPYLNISNYQSWQEVVDWALPYYVIDTQGEQFNQAIDELKKRKRTLSNKLSRQLNWRKSQFVTWGWKMVLGHTRLVSPSKFCNKVMETAKTKHYY
ncbi:hypothetical protein QW180_15435 [Vibrio sinaloensis]|nr:hypothetical protein [Vibrio sinaloensis]